MDANPHLNNRRGQNRRHPRSSVSVPAELLSVLDLGTLTWGGRSVKNLGIKVDLQRLACLSTGALKNDARLYFLAHCLAYYSYLLYP